MLLATDYILPNVLTGYTRAALAASQFNQFTLSRWLPNVPIDDLEYRLNNGAQGLADSAVFRTYDAESPIGKGPSFTRMTGELPPISQKNRLGEYDRLRLRRLSDTQIQDALLKVADRQVLSIAARYELARADALVNGSVTISENGITGMVVDFQRSSSMTVTAATLWSGAADILTDLMTWRDAYVDLNGTEPGAILAGRTLISTMLRNQAVRNQIFPGTNQPNVATVEQVNALLASQELPPIISYTTKIKVNGTAQFVIPSNKLLMLPAPGAPDAGQDGEGHELGGTFLGTTAESLEPEYQLEDGEQPGIVTGVYKSQDPVSVWTKSASIGLPVLANANLVLAATVL